MPPTETDEQAKAYIAALLREREGYERYGNADGVAQVNAELERAGANAAPPAKRAAKRAKAGDARKRTEL